jgi:hypothetical protein
MQSARLNLQIIDVFQKLSLLQRTYFLNEQETKYVSIYLKDRSEVKIRNSSGHVGNDTVVHSADIRE